MVQRFTNRDHLIGIGVYDSDGTPVVITPGLSSLLSGSPKLTQELLSTRRESKFLGLRLKRVHVLSVPLHTLGESGSGELLIIHDATFIRIAILRIWSRVFVHIAIQVLVIAVIIWLVLRWSLAGPIDRVVQWMKVLRTGRHVAVLAYAKPHRAHLQDFALDVSLGCL